MTPRQRKLKLESIIMLITGAGFTVDHYGNYKASTIDTDYRIKIKKVNIRIESKRPGTSTWFKVISKPISSIEIVTLVNFIKRFTN